MLWMWMLSEGNVTTVVKKTCMMGIQESLGTGKCYPSYLHTGLISDLISYGF